MSFGSLATVVPTAASKNQVLYTAPVGKLVEGKVYITNRSSSEIRIRVGLSTGGLEQFDANKGYTIFEQRLLPNEYYESDKLFFADGQSVIIRSSDILSTFTFLGVETENRESAGFLAQGRSTTGKSNELLFAVPTSYKQFKGNLYVCNRSSSDTKIRVGVGTTSTDYIEYNYIVTRGQTHFRSDLRISGGDSIYFRSDNIDTNFVLTGYYENFVTFPGDVGIGSTVQAQNAYIKSSVGIGTSIPGSNSLKVVGNTNLEDLSVVDDVIVGGDLSVAGFSTFASTVTFQGGTVNLGVGTETAVVLNANVSSNVTPSTNNTYDLGQDYQKWRYIWCSDTVSTKDIVISGISTIGTIGVGNTQTQIIVGGANTSIVTSASVAINGDLIIKGEVGIGTTTQKQIRYNPTSDWVEVYNKSLTRWMPILGVDNRHVEVGSNYNANPFETLWVDTFNGGAFTIFLPSSPEKGDRIKIYDLYRYFGTNNLTIDRNGKVIMGDNENLVVTTEGASFELVFYNNTRGWLVFPV